MKGWTGNTFDIPVTFGFGGNIEVEIEEAIPRGRSLQFQNQYRLDRATGDYRSVVVPSPVVGIHVKDTHRLQQQIVEFLVGIAHRGFKGFPEQCFQAPDAKIHRDLLNIIHRFHQMDVLASTKCSAVRGCLQLVVVNFAMTHAWTIDEPRRAWVEDRLKCQPDVHFATQTSPRLLNRELKSYTSELQGQLISQILDGIQKAITSSKFIKFWVPSVIQLLVLAITAESLQPSRLCKEATEKRERTILASNNDAVVDVRTMENRMNDLITLFSAKYPKEKKTGQTFRPVASESDRGLLLDPNHKEFASALRQVINKHGQCIHREQAIFPSLHC